MKLLFLISTLSAFLFLGACSSDSSGGGSTSNAGTALTEIVATMKSIDSLVSSSSLPSRGGVATTYCGVNGDPASGGMAVSESDNNYASGLGFCQATSNSQSPDTAIGAIYIAMGVACEANQLGLFATPGSQTTDLTFSTTCWGTQAEVDAIVADVGSSSISGVTLTVAQQDVSATGYDYSITYEIPGDDTGVVYLRSSGGVKAALSNAGWAVQLNENTGSIKYEGIDDSNNRRIRILVNGTISGTTFSAVSSFSGFYMQGSSSSVLNYLVVFAGDLTAGIIGSYYRSGSDNTNNCHLPGSPSATCSGITGISSSQSEGTDQLTAISSAKANLVATPTGLIDFSSIDVTDLDVTN